MENSTRMKGPVSIIELSGRFDAYSAPPVATWLADTSEKSKVVVNLSGVNFIDSSALATLVQGMKHCRLHNGDLRLTGLQQPVRVILELTRLDRAFSIFSSESDAVNSFAG